MKVKQGFFRKEKWKKWVQMYATEDRDKILVAFQFFFNRDSANLIPALKGLEFYGEAKSQIQN